MKKQLAAFLFTIAFISGCASIKPDVYTSIYHLDKPAEESSLITSIELRKKGKNMTIDEALPLLKEHVAELNIGKKVVISNIKMTPFIQKKQGINSSKHCSYDNPYSKLPKTQVNNFYKSEQANKTCNTRFYRTAKSKPYIQITADVLTYTNNI